MATATKRPKKYDEGTIPKAGVASPYSFDYGRPLGYDNDMRKKAGYAPVSNTKTKRKPATTAKKKK